MKVCHIVPGFFPGIAPPVEYTRHLVSNGIDVDVICLGHVNEKEYDSIEGVQIVRAVSRSRGPAKFTSFISFLGYVRKLLGDRRYDLIHVYAFRGCGLLPLIASGAAQYWILHIRTGSTSPRAKVANWLTKVESRPFDEIIVLHRGVGELVLGKSSKFQVVPLGANVEIKTRARNLELRKHLGITEDELLVIFIGRFDNPLRMPERIIEAFARARKDCDRLKLMLVGGGRNLPQLQQLATDRGVGSSVIWLGEVMRSEIPRFLGAADLALAYVPSIPQFERQPPLKTVEYLAFGLPVIATDTEGNRQFITHEKNGLLVEDNVDAIGHRIVELARNSKLRKVFSEVAPQSVEQFDWDRIVAEKLLPIYRDLLKE